MVIICFSFLSVCVSVCSTHSHFRKTLKTIGIRYVNEILIMFREYIAMEVGWVVVVVGRGCLYSNRLSLEVKLNIREPFIFYVPSYRSNHF